MHFTVFPWNWNGPFLPWEIPLLFNFSVRAWDVIFGLSSVSLLSPLFHPILQTPFIPYFASTSLNIAALPLCILVSSYFGSFCDSSFLFFSLPVSSFLLTISARRPSGFPSRSSTIIMRIIFDTNYMECKRILARFHLPISVSDACGIPGHHVLQRLLQTFLATLGGSLRATTPVQLPWRSCPPNPRPEPNAPSHTDYGVRCQLLSSHSESPANPPRALVHGPTPLGKSATPKPLLECSQANANGLPNRRKGEPKKKVGVPCILGAGRNGSRKPKMASTQLATQLLAEPPILWAHLKLAYRARVRRTSPILSFSIVYFFFGREWSRPIFKIAPFSRPFFSFLFFSSFPSLSRR